MEITVKMGLDFYREWIASEVIDNFHLDDTDLLMSIKSQGQWEEHCFEDIFDFDAERVAFTVCMLKARKTKHFAFVTFSESALAYVLHPESLAWQIEEKWAGWEEEGASYVSSGLRILQKLWDDIAGTDLQQRLRETCIASRQSMSDAMMEIHRRMSE